MYSLPYSKNLCFIGRENIIDKIEHKLFYLGVERVALAGLGGMGKTQVALEVAHRVKETMEDYSVFWMAAQTMDAFDKAAAELVETLGISLGPKQHAAEALQTHLASDALGPWFIVVDNIDDMSVVDGTPDEPRGLLSCLPKHRHGRILFTTRTLKVAHNMVDPPNVVNLKEMSFDEGKRYMDMCLAQDPESQTDDANEALSSLLERLDYLPLAMAQAVAYMNASRMSIREYLRHYGEMEEDHDNASITHFFGSQLRDETFHNRSQGAIVTTWSMSFVAIRNTSTAAAQLLSFIRWISPKSIPTSILPPAESVSQQELGKVDAINLLCSYNFLSRRDDGKMLDMHRLVHLALKSYSTQLFDESQTRIEASCHLSRIFPNDKPHNRALWQEYFPHVLPHVTTEITHDSAAQLGISVGCCLRIDWRWKTAIAVHQKAVEFHKVNSPEDDPKRLQAQGELGTSYLQNRHYQDTIATLDNPTQLANWPDSKFTLAFAYLRSEKYRPAIEVMKSIERDAEKEGLDQDDALRLIYQRLLAEALFGNGQDQMAIKILTRIAAVQNPHVFAEFVLPAKHLLAEVLLSNGQVKKGLALLQDLVNSQKNTLPETHEMRLKSQLQLAKAWMAHGHLEEAIGLLKLIVEVCPPAVEKNNLIFHSIQLQLVSAYDKIGKFKDADKLVEHVRATMKEAFENTEMPWY